MHQKMRCEKIGCKRNWSWLGFGLAKFGGLAFFALVAKLVNKWSYDFYAILLGNCHKCIKNQVWKVCDPARWPKRKSLASSNLYRLCAVLGSVLHLDSPQEPAKDRTTPLRPITLWRPSQGLNHQNTKRKLRTSGTVQNSVSAYSSSHKRKRSIQKRAYLKTSLGSLIYLLIFCLLTVTHLDTWLASSCTRVTI